MSIEVEVRPADLAELEHMFERDVCHLFDLDGFALHSFCGVPRSEQPKHAVNSSQYSLVCKGCGRLRCIKCRANLIFRCQHRA